MSTPENIPTEVREMLASMGLRHPLDGSTDERRANTIAQRERIARAADRVGNDVEAARQRRVVARMKAAR